MGYLSPLFPRCGSRNMDASPPLAGLLVAIQFDIRHPLQSDLKMVRAQQGFPSACPPLSIRLSCCLHVRLFVQANGDGHAVSPSIISGASFPRVRTGACMMSVCQTSRSTGRLIEPAAQKIIPCTHFVDALPRFRTSLPFSSTLQSSDRRARNATSC